MAKAAIENRVPALMKLVGECFDAGDADIRRYA
jgi:hypothetical protein